MVIRPIRLIFGLLIIFFSGTIAVPGQVGRAPPSPAAPALRMLRLVYTDYPPFTFQAPDGQPTGFSMEIAQQVAKHRGIALSYRRVDSIEAAIAAITSGAADLHPALAQTPDRAQALAFTAPIAQSFTTLHVAVTDSARFRNRNLAGATIGFVSKSATEPQVRAIPGAVVVEFPNNAALVAALAARQIDLALCGEDVFAYTLNQLGLPNRYTQIGDPLRRLDLSIALAKGQSPLVAELNVAIHDVLIQETYSNIYKKWFGPPPPFWTAQRIVLASAVFLVSVIIVSGFLIFRQRESARQLVLAQTRDNERLALEQAEQLAKSNAELAQKNAELETLVRVVSHDLRSPMVTVRGFAEMLDEALTSGNLAVATDASRRILRSTARLGEITDDLIDISRIERSELDITEVDLAGLLESVRHMLESQLAQAGARLILAGDVSSFRADARKTMRVVLNLVSNAIKYGCPEPGMTIEVSAAQFHLTDGRSITRICVADHGPGIDAAMHRDIFGVFVRAGPGPHSGSGLGLAIVEKIAQRHGGRAWVESSPGRGAAFYVEFLDTGLADTLGDHAA